MTQTLLNLTKSEDIVVNIVKGKFALRNKNDAIRLIINKYREESLEPSLRPEYVEELKGIMKQKGRKFSSMKDFDSYFEKNV